MKIYVSASTPLGRWRSRGLPRCTRRKKWAGRRPLANAVTMGKKKAGRRDDDDPFADLGEDVSQNAANAAPAEGAEGCVARGAAGGD